MKFQVRLQSVVKLLDANMLKKWTVVIAKVRVQPKLGCSLN